MLHLGSSEFYLPVRALPRRELELLSTQLFDEWERHADTALSLRDYSLFLQVDEGSINGKGAIAASLVALYAGISSYGGFMSGVDTITQQVKSITQFLADHAPYKYSCDDRKATVNKKGGVPSAIRRLFVQVQKGELTPEEATVRAERLIGLEAATAPGFLESLVEALHNCPRFHEQSALLFEDEPESYEEIADAPSKPTSPRPRPPLAPPLSFRVEVWRESKDDERRIRTVRLRGGA